jgi:imidazolonepropionase-like amidohydrolase
MDHEDRGSAGSGKEQTMTITMLRKRITLGTICAAILLTGAFAGSANERETTTVLTNCNVIDATGSPPLKNASVVIVGNRIAAVGSGADAAAFIDDGAQVVDLHGGWVLPGLWNNHTHLGDLLPDPKNLLEDEPLWRASARAGRNAVDALKAGFTTLRGAGDRDYLDVTWKKVFDSGTFIGPRIIPCGNPISSAPDDDWLTVAPEGPEAAREAVRNHIRNGAELIKIMVTRMSPEEIEAAIDEAHKHGLRVTAHANEEMGRVAVDFGVDSIEHGNDLTDDTIRVMAEKGVFLDPTIVCNLSAKFITEREEQIRAAGFISDPDTIEGRILVTKADERSQADAERAREVLNKAYDAGIKITTGSDSNPIDELGILEIEQLVFSGLPEMAAIMAATSNSADAVGMLDELGAIEAGKLADLIVVEKNPLENISNLRSLKMVIKDGKRVNLARDEGQTSFWKLYFLE